MITILSSQTSDRLTYVLDFIFREVLNFEFVLVKDATQISQNSHLCILYANQVGNVELPCPFIHIPADTLLFENHINHNIPSVSVHQNGLPYLFKSKKTNDFDFDLFSMVFYLLTRYEEYGNTQKDSFGRFPSKNSIAGKHDFLEWPIIDLWIRMLKEQIKQKCGLTSYKNQHFTIFPTIDIDKVWAFAYPTFFTWKGWLKDMILFRFSSLRDRLISIQHPVKDPFFTFNTLDKHLSKAMEKPLFFFLFAKHPTGYDINHSRSLTPFIKWLTTFCKSRSCGMHPSMASIKQTDILIEEKNALSSAISQPITASRQHFIQLSMPQTYQNLISAGITDDYSMGYPDQIGYRASTAHSFYWFDLSENQKTTLRIHPFQIMDVTLKKYMAFSPEDAIVYIEKMISLAKTEDIPLRFIWHNSSFYAPYGWKNWENVFVFLCQNHRSS